MLLYISSWDVNVAFGILKMAMDRSMHLSFRYGTIVSALIFINRLEQLFERARGSVWLGRIIGFEW